MKRTSLSKKRRFEVFKRDGFTCQYCGETPPNVILHIDHIISVKDGGSNDEDNLITACQACNLGKGARLLSEIPRPLKERMEEIKEREAQIAGYNELLISVKSRKEDQAWDVASALYGSDSIDAFNRRDFTSIEMFLDRLPYADVLQAAEIAFSRVSSYQARFKYFCGICWRVIREGWT